MTPTRRVLMIVTSHDRMGETGKPTGLWAEELAVPYYALADSGVEVVVASTRGGPVPIDPSSLKARGENPPEVERLFDDRALRAAIDATPAVATLDAAAFDAVFLPGGHGTMWDLPGDPGVVRAVEAAEASGRVVAAVCHGPAGLVGAKRPDGRPLVEGRRVAGFTDAEERAAGLADVVPFLLETRLRELGGRFEGVEPWQPFAVRDGRLVTGQNPQSSGRVAGLLLEAIGVPQAERA